MNNFILTFWIIILAAFNYTDSQNSNNLQNSDNLKLDFVAFSTDNNAFIYQSLTDSTKSCTSCHDDLLVNETVHAPAGKDCQRCHINNGTEHPLDNSIGFTLKEEVPNLCYECHDPKNEEEHVHSPASKGECLTCHSPHSSPNLYLVKANPVSKLCLECHELNVPKGNMVHGAITEGNCVACHNPHQADNEIFLASSRTSRLCSKCHKNIKKDLKLEHIHKPFKDECFACHNGHSSKEAHLSDLVTKELCLNCHEDMHNTLGNAKLNHEAINVQETCLNCHSPHASNEPKILIKKEQELCLDCHNKAITTDATMVASIGQFLKKGNVIHGAIVENGCSVCHQPHASNRHTLLMESFPEGAYSPAQVDNFALCFKCHDKTLFETAKSTNTNFRNEEDNLHYKHIKGNKGRNCNLCHNVHGATNEHLIESKTWFGNWEMPINYKAFENGGSCAPGCHEEKKYIRYELPDSLRIGN